MTKEDAYKELIEKGFKFPKAQSIMHAFRNTYKNEYPFIEQDGDKWHCTHEQIKFLYYYTKEECILADAIYQLQKNDFEANHYIRTVEFALKLIK